MSGFQPSQYQQDIFDWVDTGYGDAVVSAVAGSGKSTTIKKCVLRIRSRNTTVFAFNVHIRDHLARELKEAGSQAEVLTIHGYGYRALRRRFPALQAASARPDEQKYRKLAEAAVMAMLEPQLSMQLRIPKLMAEAKKVVLARTQYLTNLARVCRLTLSEPEDVQDLMALGDRFELGDVDGPEVEGRLMRALPGVLASGLEQIAQGQIDYTDMLYGPLMLGARPWTWEWALVDEAQDLSAAQRELVLWGRGRGGRLIAMGDPYQAIMGFAGADAASYREIQRRTEARELPLSICYRCPASHLDLARRIVPHIEARPDAPVGAIELTTQDAYRAGAREGDLILCRLTAPLVAECLKLIARRLPARVRGRDIGKQICDLARAVDRAQPDYRGFLAAIDRITEAQVQALMQREGTEQKIQGIRDMAEALETCVLHFDVDNVTALCKEIEALFVDEEASIWLSTIHRAKGLEADRVVILRPQLLPFDRPRMTPDQRAQEWNIFYVALTRAKRELIFAYEREQDIPDEPEVPVYAGGDDAAK